MSKRIVGVRVLVENDSMWDSVSEGFGHTYTVASANRPNVGEKG